MAGAYLATGEKLKRLFSEFWSRTSEAPTVPQRLNLRVGRFTSTCLEGQYSRRDGDLWGLIGNLGREYLIEIIGRAGRLSAAVKGARSPIQ